MTEVAFDKGQIENYKGIMLCTRPGDTNNQKIERPFISRVDPKQNIGINPCNIIQHRTYKQGIFKLSLVDDKLIKHKKWLQEFSLRTKLKNEQNQQSSDIDLDRIERVCYYQFQIKQKAAEDRKKTKEMKEEYKKIQNVVKNIEINDQNKENIKQNIEDVESQKKKNKPTWALTRQEQEQKEDLEIDNLLNFVQDLDYDNYINDVEVNTMLDSLKLRIDQIKKDKSDRILAEQKEEELLNNLKQEQNDDQRSMTRSQKSTQQIREQIIDKIKQEDQKDWEDNISQKSKQQKMQDKIAKQVADEILDQYKGLKQVHSNSSIRKILENQAYKMLQNGYSIQGPKIAVTKTVQIDKNNVDPSYLPYLHRNPAV